MRKIRGQVNCAEKANIEAGAVAQVKVIDCSRACASSKDLGVTLVKDPKSFPFEYEVEFDDTKVIVGIPHGFAVQVRIEKEDKLLFINDTRHPIISNDGQILDNLNVQVIVVQ